MNTGANTCVFFCKIILIHCRAHNNKQKGSDSMKKQNRRKQKLSYESDGKMGKSIIQKGNKNEDAAMFFNSTQNSE